MRHSIERPCASASSRAVAIRVSSRSTPVTCAPDAAAARLCRPSPQARSSTRAPGPSPFISPLHGGARLSPWRLAAGMWLYDALALFRNVRGHRMLGKRALLEAEPMLRERGLLGGARFYDAQCDDARLVLATARSAIHHGALVANYMTVRALERTAGRVVGAQLEDGLTGERGVIRASVVVNATGPWADRVRR